MKPSHTTTPRTLAECHFATGYRHADPVRNTVADLAIWLAVCVAWLAACIAVGLLLALSAIPT